MKSVYIKNLFLDFIPAISGLIGKIALVSSFAFVWAQQLDITYENFIFLNVRLELIIAAVITLVAVLLFPEASPPGTLAPLIVLVPFMVNYGVHPLILSIMVAVLGIIAVSTGLFKKLYLLSGHKSKSALGLVFGISGIIMSVETLFDFFNNLLPLGLILAILSIIYFVLTKYKKIWLIILISVFVSLPIAYLFGFEIDFSSQNNNIIINPSYWWNDIWNIGWGLDIKTILVTLPFAFFVIVLWTIDTLSINAIKEDFNKDFEMDLGSSFYVASFRNLMGGLLGGAQTSSIWRSFLIPLFMTKRPIRQSAFLLGAMCLVVALWGYPIHTLSFTPLIWSVLLFGIFLPLTVTGIKSLIKMDRVSIIVILLSCLLGIFINPILTWLAMVLYEKISKRMRENKKS